jgi:hypothetical protein
MTFFLSFAGSVARLGTVLAETSDRLYQFQFILSVFLNGFIVLQFFLYWSSHKKVDSSKGKGGDKPSSTSTKTTTKGKTETKKSKWTWDPLVYSP